MAKRSAGLLAYRRREDRLEVLLVHPGGPYWRDKDAGAWSVPKGEHGPDEDAFAAACREFGEETGWVLPAPRDGDADPAAGSEFFYLGETRLNSGKVVEAWAFAGEFDPATLRSNTFTFEWPRGSGRMHEYPEVDRADWFSLEAARVKMHPAQAAFLERLAAQLEPSNG